MDQITPRRRRTQQERSAEASLKLIKATITCIARFSYAYATTKRIAELSGLTRGAIQHHFESREDLILAAWNHVHEQFLMAHELEVVPGGTLESTVGQLVDRLWRMYSSSDYLVATEIRLCARADATLAKRLMEDVEIFNQNYERRWQSIFAKFSYPARIEQCKRVVNGALRGLALQKVTERDSEYYDAAVETCKRMMIDHLSKRT